jgi:hypothetical protein
MKKKPDPKENLKKGGKDHSPERDRSPSPNKQGQEKKEEEHKKVVFKGKHIYNI